MLRAVSLCAVLCMGLINCGGQVVDSTRGDNRGADYVCGPACGTPYFPVVISLDRIDPAVPVENRPVTVYFTATNTFNDGNAPRTGSVTGYVKPGPCFIQGCDASQPIGSLLVDGLAVGSSVSGSFTFTAPAASKDNIVTLQFFDRSASEVYPPPSGEVTDSLGTAARYRVILNSMHITTTRAHFQDTDYAELTVGVNGNALPMQSVSLGSLSSGDQPGRTTDYPLGLVSDTFDLVPRDDVGIRFNYAVLNAGFNGNHVM